MANPRLIDMTGMRFGRWTVLKKAGNYSQGAALWLCRCDCGSEKTLFGGDLRKGKSASCGCLNREIMLERFTTHGGKGTRLYRIWKAMRTRCTNPKIPGWKNYGGRGIRICEAWDDFSVFRTWAIANGYADGLSIEREDTNGNYTPENCTWATALTQSRNRRFVRKAPSGEAWSAIACRHGIPATLMNGRIHEGWPVEKAATLPKGSRLAP